jgi:hypothetical protein
MGSSHTRSMDVGHRFSSIVLRFIGSDLATGLTPVQGILPTISKTHIFRFIVNGNWLEGLIPQGIIENLSPNSLDIRD